MIMKKTHQVSSFIISIFFFFQLIGFSAADGGGGGGSRGTWSVLQSSIGISAMHMQLLPNDRVLIYDRTDFGLSNISLPNGKCRTDPTDTASTFDCTAHSIEYDIVSNSIRPLMVLTDVWCSSASLFPDGSVVQTGGYNDGEKTVRIFRPCPVCDWEEITDGLAARRWYSTNHILPDRRQIIIGGRRQFNYEFYPKTLTSLDAYNLPFLSETTDPTEENNLYPFVFLNTDGNLFIFANNRAILFDYQTSTVFKNYPEIPGGDPRSYPSTGSAVLLPLKNPAEPEVLVCGGTPKGSYTSAENGQFVGALNTCGRIRINDPDPQWVIETMPFGRVMGDMLLLPNGHVLIINGAGAGSAGWEMGRDPILNPVIYRPDLEIGSIRFEVQNPGTTPRLYHSTAILLRDGRVLVGGSNPHTYYNFTGVLYPTDLSLEQFSPSYLDPGLSSLRPFIIAPFSQAGFLYGQLVPIRFIITGIVDFNTVLVTLLSPPFNTHSFSMNQRLLILDKSNPIVLGISTFEVIARIPISSTLAPPGFYLLFVVHKEIPSVGIWVHIDQ